MLKITISLSFHDSLCNHELQVGTIEIREHKERKITIKKKVNKYHLIYL